MAGTGGNSGKKESDADKIKRERAEARAKAKYKAKIDGYKEDIKKAEKLIDQISKREIGVTEFKEKMKAYVSTEAEINKLVRSVGLFGKISKSRFHELYKNLDSNKSAIGDINEALNQLNAEASKTTDSLGSLSSEMSTVLLGLGDDFKSAFAGLDIDIDITKPLNADILEASGKLKNLKMFYGGFLKDIANSQMEYKFDPEVAKEYKDKFEKISEIIKEQEDEMLKITSDTSNTAKDTEKEKTKAIIQTISAQVAAAKKLRDSYKDQLDIKNREFSIIKEGNLKLLDIADETSNQIRSGLGMLSRGNITGAIRELKDMTKNFKALQGAIKTNVDNAQGGDKATAALVGLLGNLKVAFQPLIMIAAAFIDVRDRMVELNKVVMDAGGLTGLGIKFDADVSFNGVAESLDKIRNDIMKVPSELWEYGATLQEHYDILGNIMQQGVKQTDWEAMGKRPTEVTKVALSVARTFGMVSSQAAGIVGKYLQNYRMDLDQMERIFGGMVKDFTESRLSVDQFFGTIENVDSAQGVFGSRMLETSDLLKKFGKYSLTGAKGAADMVESLAKQLGEIDTFKVMGIVNAFTPGERANIVRKEKDKVQAELEKLSAIPADKLDEQTKGILRSTQIRLKPLSTMVDRLTTDPNYTITQEDMATLYPTFTVTGQLNTVLEGVAKQTGNSMQDMLVGLKEGGSEFWTKQFESDMMLFNKNVEDLLFGGDLKKVPEFLTTLQGVIIENKGDLSDVGSLLDQAVKQQEESKKITDKTSKYTKTMGQHLVTSNDAMQDVMLATKNAFYPMLRNIEKLVAVLAGASSTDLPPDLTKGDSPEKAVESIADSFTQFQKKSAEMKASGQDPLQLWTDEANKNMISLYKMIASGGASEDYYKAYPNLRKQILDEMPESVKKEVFDKLTSAEAGLITNAEFLKKQAKEGKISMSDILSNAKFKKGSTSQIVDMFGEAGAGSTSTLNRAVIGIATANKQDITENKFPTSGDVASEVPKTNAQKEYVRTQDFKEGKTNVLHKTDKSTPGADFLNWAIKSISNIGKSSGEISGKSASGTIIKVQLNLNSNDKKDQVANANNAVQESYLQIYGV